MSIRALGYIVIESPDLAAWDRFMTDVVGLMPADGAPDGVKLYRMDDRPFRFWIQEGQTERVVAAGLEIAGEAEFGAIVARLVSAGHVIERASEQDAAKRGVKGLIRTQDTAGNGLELFHGDTRDNVPFVSPAGVSGFVTGEMGLGHCVFAAPNFAETHAYYHELLGLGDTDTPSFQLGGPEGPSMGFAFMHADNGRHHSIAIGELPQPPSGCIHIMVEACTLEDVGQAYDRMRLAGIPVSATLGQHVNDQMTSFYMQLSLIHI